MKYQAINMAYQLLIVFLVLIGTTMREMERVEGKVKFCQEGLGTCGAVRDDCSSKCYRRHPDDKSTGSCDTSTSPPLCTCFYRCGAEEEKIKANNSSAAATATTTRSAAEFPPLEKKTKYCEAGGIGLCSKTCDAHCCSAKCAQRYSQGDGYCQQLDNTFLCQCQYVC